MLGRRRQPFEVGESGAQGQSLVEFALVMPILFFILLGIIQFGFIFNTYVTLTNAVREGARTGSIYIYSASLSKDQNDTARDGAIRAAGIASMNLLGTTAPRFTTTGTWLHSGLVYVNGDLVVTYAVPAGVTDSDSRVGEQITVRVTYHQDLVIPLVDRLLPHDSGGRLAMSSEVTMVLN